MSTVSEVDWPIYIYTVAYIGRRASLKQINWTVPVTLYNVYRVLQALSRKTGCPECGDRWAVFGAMCYLLRGAKLIVTPFRNWGSLKCSVNVLLPNIVIPLGCKSLESCPISSQLPKCDIIFFIKNFKCLYMTLEMVIIYPNSKNIRIKYFLHTPTRGLFHSVLWSLLTQSGK